MYVSRISGCLPNELWRLDDRRPAAAAAIAAIAAIGVTHPRGRRLREWKSFWRKEARFPLAAQPYDIYPDKRRRSLLRR